MRPAWMLCRATDRQLFSLKTQIKCLQRRGTIC
jgi:hypothetical protein